MRTLTQDEANEAAGGKALPGDPTRPTPDPAPRGPAPIFRMPPTDP